MAHDPEDVLRFWLEEKSPADWYKGGAALDAEIRARFLSAWEAARDGALFDWIHTARGALAFLILTDQFSRNIHRDDARAFATDPLARAVAARSVAADLDQQIDPSPRQFFFLPFEHSEDMADQDRAVALIGERMEAPETLLHARVHREIIARFGRFPFRNEALGRASTPEERAFMDEGGYGALLRAFQDG
ncbi:DUF924 family protein [Jannaschia ovalis]|uniref:DUF924 domain-containing protein n=1 Tax=Jannaschia ovalis TaxID=3038773 RepID=A0ABY8LA38_9RHOB|nr:DUF924 family protein [Jannaschia sp. GRR-S6-38]WGH78218.1 DUF924 domain-containing protein [Jannaschia sp. GRR-S6-38]